MDEKRQPLGHGAGVLKITADGLAINGQSTTETRVAPPIATCVVACSPAACCCKAAQIDQAVTEHTRAMLLAPPEVLTLETVWTWGHRLRRGVETHTILQREANEAWRRVVAKMGGAHGVDPS